MCLHLRTWGGGGGGLIIGIQQQQNEEKTSFASNLYVNHISSRIYRRFFATLSLSLSPSSYASHITDSRKSIESRAKERRAYPCLCIHAAAAAMAPLVADTTCKLLNIHRCGIHFSFAVRCVCVCIRCGSQRRVLIDSRLCQQIDVLGPRVCVSMCVRVCVVWKETRCNDER